MRLRAKVYPYTSVKQTYMSDADTGAGDNGPEMVQINLRLSKSFLEDIDTMWEEQGFNSRSEGTHYGS